MATINRIWEHQNLCSKSIKLVPFAERDKEKDKGGENRSEIKKYMDLTNKQTNINK